MAITYKKLDTSSHSPATEVVAEGDEWKVVNVEKSVTQSPLKTSHTYAQTKAELDIAKAKVAELEADLAEIEAKAKP